MINSCEKTSIFSESAHTSRETNCEGQTSANYLQKTSNEDINEDINKGIKYEIMNKCVEYMFNTYENEGRI